MHYSPAAVLLMAFIPPSQHPTNTAAALSATSLTHSRTYALTRPDTTEFHVEEACVQPLHLTSDCNTTLHIFLCNTVWLVSTLYVGPDPTRLQHSPNPVPQPFGGGWRSSVQVALPRRVLRWHVPKIPLVKLLC